ncbi:Lrp/AsnC family transcriptional regulator [Caldiplasma sukawensis]
MSLAIVMVSTVPGKEKEVLEKISKINYVVECYAIMGEFDVFAKIDAKDYNELSKVIVENIRTMTGVVDTKTFPVIKL